MKIKFEGVITGNIDANGDINSSGTITGTVTHPIGTTYSGTVPGGGEIIGTPNIPVLPSLPAPTVFPAAGSTNITSNTTISPGSYGDIILPGKKTITFAGPGVYVFNSINNSGSANTFKFNFQNNAIGEVYIYVHGNAWLGKFKSSFQNGGDAS
ncbi:unnamed protein product, partial [marine sediment metagenome]